MAALLGEAAAPLVDAPLGPETLEHLLRAQAAQLTLTLNLTPTLHLTLGPPLLHTHTHTYTHIHTHIHTIRRRFCAGLRLRHTLR